MSMRTARMPLAEWAEQLRSGAADPEDLVRLACDRLEAGESDIHALLPEPGRRERLLEEAQRLKKLHLDPATRPPLFGIPVGVKDIFRVDGFETRAGTDLPPDVFAGEEAVSVRRLKNAGALILGKTVTTELAFSEPGPTRNPHHPEHTPGGSSSGSAAAVAMGYCPLALGTQTIGSITRPAAYCGVYGFKPSQGAIPGDGVIPFSPSVDQIGFFTQDINGLALAASVLCDGWKSLDRHGTGDGTYVLGIPTGNYLEQASPDIRAFFETYTAHLAKAGHKLKRMDVFSDIETINAAHYRLIAFELAKAHAHWYDMYGDRCRPGTRRMMEEGRKIPPEQAARDRAGRDKLRDRILSLSVEQGIDAWISPATVTPPPRGLESTGSPLMNLPWTHAGLPTVSMPAGFGASHLPMAVQLAGHHGKDGKLLAIAAQLPEPVTASQALPGSA